MMISGPVFIEIGVVPFELDFVFESIGLSIGRADNLRGMKMRGGIGENLGRNFGFEFGDGEPVDCLLDEPLHDLKISNNK